MFNTILPALVGNDAGITEWITFGANILALEPVYKWPITSEYIIEQLQQKIHDREPFGAHDRNIMSDINERHKGSAATATASSSASPSHSSSFGGVGGDPNSSRQCQHYNFSDAGCKYGSQCKSRHQCGILTCDRKDEPHLGKRCSQYDGRFHKNGRFVGGDTSPAAASTATPTAKTERTVKLKGALRKK